jgi:hypothetical protein
LDTRGIGKLPPSRAPAFPLNAAAYAEDLLLRRLWLGREAIRDLRVAAAGHPTLQDRPKKLPRRAHFISQITQGDGGMKLLTVDGSGQPLFRDVQIPRLAAEQEKYILGLIRQALARLT